MSILRSYVVVMPDSGMFIVLNRDMSFVFTYVQAVSQNRTLPGTNRNKGVYSDFFIVGEKYGAVNGPAHDLPEFRPTPHLIYIGKIIFRKTTTNISRIN